MQFKHSPVMGVISAGEVQASRKPFSNVSMGSRVTLHPDLVDCDDEMYAEVVEIEGDVLQVRALHDVYCSATERVVKFGDPFSVTRDQVFAVRLLPA